MKTAPKDGTFIQIAYPSFSDNGMVYVGHGRWVDVPHEAEVEAYVASLYPCHRDADVPTADPHWEVAYVSICDHSGQHYTGRSYGSRSICIRHPIGWLPLPKPPKAPRS